MAALRSDPATRRRLDSRVSALKRRLGIASVLGFGALFGLVTQHAVGAQKHKAARATRPVAARSPASSFFDANDSGYSFDDSGVRAAARQGGGVSAPQSAPPQGQPPPVARSGGS